MKKLIYVLTISLSCILVIACGNGKTAEEQAKSEAQNEQAAEDEMNDLLNDMEAEETSEETTEEKAQLVDHVCTAKCKEAGKCVTACGEKGHVCTDACHKPKEKDADGHDHDHDHGDHSHSHEG